MLSKVRVHIEERCKRYSTISKKWEEHAKRLERRNGQKSGEQPQQHHPSSSLLQRPSTRSGNVEPKDLITSSFSPDRDTSAPSSRSATSIVAPQDPQLPPIAPEEQEPRLDGSPPQHDEAEDIQQTEVLLPMNNAEETLDPEDHETETETTSGQGSSQPFTALDDKNTDDGTTAPTTAQPNHNQNHNHPDSSPVFISERSLLKRKRASTPPRGRNRNADDDRGKKNDNHGRRIKDESLDSSPTATVRLPQQVMLAWTDSLDLDDIGQHTRTPRKKKKVKRQPKIDEEGGREVDDTDAEEQQEEDEEEGNDTDEEEDDEDVDEDHTSPQNHSHHINNERESPSNLAHHHHQQQESPNREHINMNNNITCPSSGIRTLNAVPKSVSPAHQHHHRRAPQQQQEQQRDTTRNRTPKTSSALVSASASTRVKTTPTPLQTRDPNTVLPRTSEPLLARHQKKRISSYSNCDTTTPSTTTPSTSTSTSSRSNSNSTTSKRRRGGTGSASAYFISMLAEDGDQQDARTGTGGSTRKTRTSGAAAAASSSSSSGGGGGGCGGRDTVAATAEKEMTSSGASSTERQTRLQTLLSGPTPERGALSITTPITTTRPSSSVRKESSSEKGKGGGGRGRGGAAVAAVATTTAVAEQTLEKRQTTPATALLARKNAGEYATTTTTIKSTPKTAARTSTSAAKPPQQKKENKQDREQQRRGSTTKAVPFAGTTAAALQKPPKTTDLPAQSHTSTPLRQRPLHTLRLTDFKPNPHHRFDTYQRPAHYSYGSEGGGGRRGAAEGRACTDPFCQRCKDMASFAEISGFVPTGTRKGLFDPSQPSSPENAGRPGPNKKARGAAPAVGEAEEEEEEEGDDGGNEEDITLTQEERERKQAEEDHILRTFLPPSHPLPSLHDPDRPVLLRQARTKLFASHFSKHRLDRGSGSGNGIGSGGGRGGGHSCSRSSTGGGGGGGGGDNVARYGRRVTPPGFWDTEMQTTQEMQANRELGEKQDRELVKERWSEAMKNTPPTEVGRGGGGRRKDRVGGGGGGGAGAWKFADE